MAIVFKTTASSTGYINTYVGTMINIFGSNYIDVQAIT
jgi:hypothetical protein